MKLQNQIISLLLGMLVLFSTSLSVTAEETYLMRVEGKTVTADMTIQQITKQFGQPKLTTDSVFGGHAYTFYGENYSNFLYIETDRNEKIASYGSIAKNFSTPNFKAGDIESRSYGHLSGYFASDYDDHIYGYIGYVVNRIPANTDAKYKDDVRWNINLCRQATLMWNAVSFIHGYNTPVTFDERTILVNQQLGENGGNLYDHCRNNGIDSYFSLISMGSYVPYGYCINPLQFAKNGQNYTAASGYYPVFVLTPQNYTLTGFLSPSFYQEKKTVPYTEEEQQRLTAVRKAYTDSVNAWNAEADYFKQSPSNQQMPLQPGVIAKGKLEGALGYLNAIRIGAGLPALQLSQELCEGAQMKAGLTEYLSAMKIDNPSPHFPPQPAGMSDADYAKAQSGGGENLYHGNVLQSITNALNDAYGDPITCGHRYNLLDPSWKTVGFGSTEVAGQLSFGIQGVHKFSGYQENDISFVGWPSEGIMISQAGAGSNTMYTGQFYQDYGVTDQTTVTFRCLNTDEEWHFTSAEENTTNHRYHINHGNQVSYYDKSIALVVGNVYQITFDHLKDSKTGEEISYTYRSVYEDAYVDEATGVPNKVTMDRTTLSASVGGTIKLHAAINPQTAVNKMITWKSSDPSVATVNENGIVTFHKTGSVTVTAATSNGLTTAANITVVDYLMGDVNRDQLVRADDALLVLRHAVGKTTLTGLQATVANVNHDSKIDAADALLILKCAVGKAVLY